MNCVFPAGKWLPAAGKKDYFGMEFTPWAAGKGPGPRPLKPWMMKIYLPLLVTALALMAPFRETMAQQRFSDGEVHYNIQVEMPPDATASADAFAGSEMTYLFKNYLTRSITHLGEAEYSTIRNARDQTAVTLIVSGNQRYMVKMNADDLKMESAKYQGLTFKDTGGSKEIAGHSCREALGTMADGKTFRVYYAPDLVPENASFSPQFRGLKGLPLQFEITTSSQVKLVMTATSVQIGPQPAAQFDIPKSGYRLLTYTELQRMRAQH